MTLDHAVVYLYGPSKPRGSKSTLPLSRAGWSNLGDCSVYSVEGVVSI